MIVDAHSHLGRAGSATDGPGAFAQALWRSRACGISHTIVFPAPGGDYSVANRRLARLVARWPHRLAGLAFVHADRDRGRVFRIALHAVQAQGFCGLKLHRRDAPLSEEVCQAARILRVPIVYDAEGELDLVTYLVRAFPDVSLIVPHLGVFNDDIQVQSHFAGMLVRYRNLYSDTSGVRCFDLLRETARRAGPHQLLFGTDGPYLHPALELQKVRLLGLPPQATAALLCDNALRLFKPRGWACAQSLRHHMISALS